VDDDEVGRYWRVSLSTATEWRTNFTRSQKAMIVEVELEECVADEDDVEHLYYQETHNQNTITYTPLSRRVRRF